MSTVATCVFAVPVTRIDEPDPVAEEEADQRMANDRFADAMLGERVPAMTCVFDPSTARRHHVDVMSEQTAEIPYALVEASVRVVRIRAKRKEERLTLEIVNRRAFAAYNRT